MTPMESSGVIRAGGVRAGTGFVGGVFWVGGVGVLPSVEVGEREGEGNNHRGTESTEKVSRGEAEGAGVLDLPAGSHPSGESRPAGDSSSSQPAVVFVCAWCEGESRTEGRGRRTELGRVSHGICQRHLEVMRAQMLAGDWRGK